MVAKNGFDPVLVPTVYYRWVILRSKANCSEMSLSFCRKDSLFRPFEWKRASQPSPTQTSEQANYSAQRNHHAQLHWMRIHVSRKFQQDPVPVLCTCMQRSQEPHTFQYFVVSSSSTFSPCHWCERKCIFPRSIEQMMWTKLQTLATSAMLTASSMLRSLSNQITIIKAYNSFRRKDDVNLTILGNKHTRYPRETLNILQNTMLNLAARNLSALENNFNWAWIFFLLFESTSQRGQICPKMFTLK